MPTLTIELTDDELDLLHAASYFNDLQTFQSEEMELFGEKLREAVEELMD
jgi:hypothetical protein